MTRHYSKIVSIAYSLATLFTLISRVAAGGYAFDTSSCSPAAISFLDYELKRALTIVRNSARILHQDEVPDDITDPIRFMMNDPEFITPVRAVFAGGQVESATWGLPQQIAGINSYSAQALPNFNSVENGRPTIDTQGNLLIYCNGARLGEATWNRQTPPYNTYDRDGRIYFRQTFRRCNPGTVAFFVHIAQGRADRVTICSWVLRPFVAAWSAGRRWDTSLSINQMRTLVVPANPADPDAPELEAFKTNRIAALQETLPELVRQYRAGILGDTDLSIGFDAWLINLLAQTRAGGYRISYNNDNQFPINGWNIATNLGRSSITGMREATGTPYSQNYMLAALVSPPGTSVIFNYYVGFGTDGTLGRFEYLFPRQGGLDFGANEVYRVSSQPPQK